MYISSKKTKFDLLYGTTRFDLSQAILTLHSWSLNHIEGEMYITYCIFLP
jgi:hypothetical protein